MNNVGKLTNSNNAENYFKLFVIQRASLSLLSPAFYYIVNNLHEQRTHRVADKARVSLFLGDKNRFLNIRQARLAGGGI